MCVWTHTTPRSHILSEVDTDVSESLESPEPFLNPDIPDDTTLVYYHSDSDYTVQVVSLSDSDEYEVIENEDTVLRTRDLEEVVAELNDLI